ncbi:MAG: hypothetical protein AB7K68_05135 [Bacteriovoracia bacterium]
MFRPSLALVWAFLSTLSAASSTLIYLYLAHGQPWAPGFIQLYSSLGIVAGWLNALIYFLAPRTIFFQTRKAALFFFFAALLMASTIYAKIFHQELSWEKLCFLATSLIPVLYANAFGIEFYEGNYPWPYRRILAFNIFIFFGAIGSLCFAHDESGLYRWGGAAGIPFFCLWLSDCWNRIDAPREKFDSIQPWLNPSLPVLERTLWDQWVVSRLDVLNWSFGIYALGRVVTFTGNVTYSYLMGTNSTAYKIKRRDNSWWPWAVMLLAAPIAAGAVKYIWCAFLLGQIFAWFITALLTTEYDSESSSYGKYLLIWFMDLTIRTVGILVAQDLKDYASFLVFSSVTGLILSLLLRRKQLLKPSPKRTSTKSLLEDFPGIR